MSNSRTKIFIANSMSALIFQVSTVLSGFIVPKVMMEFYGSEINGLIVSITQFVSYFSLVEAGISGATVYALYKPLAERNTKTINGIIVAARDFYYKSGYIFTLLVLVLGLLFPFFVKTSELSYYEIVLLVIILSVSGMMDFFTLAKYQSLLLADQKNYIISLSSTCAVIINTIIIVLLSFFKIDVVVVRAVALLSVFLKSLIVYVYVLKKYKFIDYKERPLKEKLNKRWDALFLQILGVVQNGAPIILVTFLESLKMVSVYSIYNLVISGVNAILNVFINGLSASFGHIIVQDDANLLKRVYKEFEGAYYVLIACVYGVAGVFITPFVYWYTKNVTDMNYNMPLLGFLLVLNGFLFNLKTPQGMMVISAGMYKETKKQSMIQAAIVLFGGLLCGWYYGVIGVIVGSIMANLYRDVELAFFIPRNVIHIQPSETIKRMIVCCCILTFSYVPSLWIEIYVDSIIDLIVFSIVWILYALMLAYIILYYVERDFIKMINEKIIRKIKRED